MVQYWFKCFLIGCLCSSVWFYLYTTKENNHAPWALDFSLLTWENHGWVSSAQLSVNAKRQSTPALCVVLWLCGQWHFRNGNMSEVLKAAISCNSGIIFNKMQNKKSGMWQMFFTFFTCLSPLSLPNLLVFPPDVSVFSQSLDKGVQTEDWGQDV